MRKGLPLFVVFIMCDVDDGATASCGAAMEKEMKTEREKGEVGGRGEFKKNGGQREEEQARLEV